jgi:hypothetical protein
MRTPLQATWTSWRSSTPYYRLLRRIFRESDGASLTGLVAYLDEVRSRLSVPAPKGPVRRQG